MEKTMMVGTTNMIMSMEKVMCEMKCMKMMMSNMMDMDVKMNVALMNKMQECDEMMNSTMSMMQRMKDKCC